MPGGGCGQCGYSCARAATPPSSPRWLARVDAGDLKIEVAERLPLAELAAVHDQAAAGRLSGKTVLTPA